ncbi:MAG: hypothetical protein ABH863_05425 [Candidatus Micrarchaeota archaeon]
MPESIFTTVANYAHGHLKEQIGEEKVTPLINNARGEAVFTVRTMGYVHSPRIEAHLRKWLAENKVPMSGAAARLGRKTGLKLLTGKRTPGFFLSVITGTRQVPGKVVIRLVGTEKEKLKWLRARGGGQKKPNE